MNRVHARRAALARAPTGFVSSPEPRSIGRVARGRQLCAGNFLFAGQMIAAPDKSLWDLTSAEPGFDAERHGFTWLDDLAAVGDRRARDVAQAWTGDWIERYGRGRGPGWTPECTGKRLVRWINHAIFLLHARDKTWSDAYYRSLGQQTIFLSRRWTAALPGVPRFEALTGLIYAGLALTGMERHVSPAITALSKECDRQIDGRGGIGSRNPEELLDVFTLLTWASAALVEVGRIPPKPILAAIERIAPTLRALRHGDGGLARFHGGGSGIEGRLDQALASSGVRTPPGQGLAMGFARLSAGRTSLIMDVAPPPSGPGYPNGHASTLATELTSGRRPLVVNCGSGTPFGADWAQAGRATASHSVLELEGYSSARFGQKRKVEGTWTEPLTVVPQDVRMRQTGDSGGVGLIAGHDGYLRTHGLTHVRTVDLARSGRSVTGDDTIATITEADQRVFDAALDRQKLNGIPYHIRFHLHPEVDATLDLNGSAVSMALKSGEIWIFRHDGVARLSLDPSVYLQEGRLRPRATKQIVLSGRASDYATRIRWTLGKAQDTPAHVRDLQVDETVYNDPS